MLCFPSVAQLIQATLVRLSLSLIFSPQALLLILRPLVWSQPHYSALSCACGFLQKRSEFPPVVSLISVCINTIKRGPSGPLVCPSYMYNKREKHVGVISTLGAGASATVPGQFVGAIQLRPLLFWTIRRLMGSKFALVCRKKTRKEVKDQVSERRVAMRIRAAVSMSVSYIAPCRSKGKRVRVGYMSVSPIWPSEMREKR